jgi:hypothetical protein
VDPLRSRSLRVIYATMKARGGLRNRDLDVTQGDGEVKQAVTRRARECAGAASWASVAALNAAKSAFDFLSPLAVRVARDER